MKINFNFEEKNVKLGLENQFTIQEFLEVTPVKILMLKGEKGDTVSAEWGTITGDIADQTDLASELDTKADKSTTYTKTEVDTALETKADTTDIPDVSDFITKDVDNLTNYTKTSDLSAVATSGDYDDLDNKPTIPSKTSDLTNDSGYIDNTVDNLTNYTKTSNLSTVATSGSYNDLSNKPTIPSKTSDLTNDSNFAVTNADNKFSVGQTIAGETVVDSIRSKNIASDTLLKLGLWISGQTKIGTNGSGWYVVVSITGGKTYTISKKNAGALYTTTTGTFPANNVPIIDSWTGGGNIKQLTISTSSNANYLFIGLLASSSPTDEQKSQAIEELMVEEGSTATTYSPYQQLDIPTSENFISRVNFVSGEESASGLFRKIGNQVIIMYQGQNKVHSGETLLFTLPEGYRPPTLIVVPFTKWSQAYGQIILYDNGQCKIGNISSTSATGRVAFNMTYTID